MTNKHPREQHGPTRKRPQQPVRTAHTRSQMKNISSHEDGVDVPSPKNIPVSNSENTIDVSSYAKNRSKLSEEELLMMRYNDMKIQPVVLWILWITTGIIGGHRYYLHDKKRAIFMTITLGGLGIWALIDSFFINKRMQERNAQLRNLMGIEPSVTFQEYSFEKFDNKN